MYARIENMQVAEYPLTDWQIKQRFPNQSFTTDFANNLPEDYVQVLPNSSPNETTNTIVTEGVPVFQDGVWIQSWVVANRYTAEELAAADAQKIKNHWNAIRRNRNELLEQSDWIVQRHRDEKELGITTTISDGAYIVWMNWRQQLRDITESVSDPSDVVFPSMPGKLNVAEF